MTAKLPTKSVDRWRIASRRVLDGRGRSVRTLVAQVSNGICSTSLKAATAVGVPVVRLPLLQETGSDLRSGFGESHLSHQRRYLVRVDHRGAYERRNELVVLRPTRGHLRCAKVVRLKAPADEDVTTIVDREWNQSCRPARM